MIQNSRVTFLPHSLVMPTRALVLLDTAQRERVCLHHTGESGAKLASLLLQSRLNISRCLMGVICRKVLRCQLPVPVLTHKTFEASRDRCYSGWLGVPFSPCLTPALHQLLLYCLRYDSSLQIPNRNYYPAQFS